MFAVADMGDVYLNRTMASVPKNLSDAQTPALDEAIRLCNEAKGITPRRRRPDLSDYCGVQDCLRRQVPQVTQTGALGPRLIEKRPGEPQPGGLRLQV